MVWSTNAGDDKKYDGKILEGTKKTRTRELVHEDRTCKVERKEQDEESWNSQAKR